MKSQLNVVSAKNYGFKCIIKLRKQKMGNSPGANFLNKGDQDT